MKRVVPCFVGSMSIALVLAATASADGWPLDEGSLGFADGSPILVDARDVVAWNAGRSIAALGDAALREISARPHIARPALPAYEPGSV